MRDADWYFDFISPYAHFAQLRFGELSRQLTIRYRPVLLAGLLKHWGQKGPAEIPGKRTWTYRACTFWATQHGIPFRFPAAHPFNPLPYLRLAIAANNTAAAVRLIFEALWTTGADPSDENIVNALAKKLDVKTVRISDPDVKDALRLETEQAAARGVFGVPTFLIDGQLFWGADAMDFVNAYLADPTIVATDEMKRVSDLPVGAARKQQ
jgi:2-hydroxychromene-2-carboxylate isomerase